MNQFELLPNEIIIECFAYLSAFDRFQSFDQLNNRFNKLIQNVPLYLNFENVRKRVFDRFCEKMIFNPEMKQLIYSLNLSNKNACGQIDIFLSLFPLNELPNLRSLSLVDPQKNDGILLKSILPFAPQLHHFYLSTFNDEFNEVLAALPLSQLRTLSVPELAFDLTSSNQMSSIIKLTIACSYYHRLIDYFKWVPKLKYLHIGKFYLDRPIDNISPITNDNSVAVHLKELIIDDFQYQFVVFQRFAKHTPNLKSLTISASIHKSIINANAWKYLITTSLPYLKHFMFKFNIYHGGQEHDDIIDMFKQFQSDFWQKEHDWHTVYVLDINFALIFTIPYCFNNYDLVWYTHSCSDKSVNYFNLHDTVTNLELHDNLSISKYPYYFAHVTELSIINQPWLPNDRLFLHGSIEYLKEKMNLSRLKKLNLASYQMETSVLLQILKESPQLSEMIVDTDLVRSCFDNSELCEHLSKMIETLHLINHNSYDGFEKFFEKFASLEKLYCGFTRMSSENSWDFWVSLMDHISQFSVISICNLSTRSICDEAFFSQLQNEALKRNLIYRLIPPDEDQTQDVCTELKIWIDEKII